MIMAVGCKTHIDQETRAEKTVSDTSLNQRNEKTNEHQQTTVAQGPSSKTYSKDEYYPPDPLPAGSPPNTPRPIHGALKSHESSTENSGQIVSFQDLEKQQDNYGLDMRKIDTKALAEDKTKKDFKFSGCQVGFGIGSLILLVILVLLGYRYLKSRANL